MAKNEAKSALDADGKVAHPIAATALKPVVDSYLDEGKAFNMGMVFPVSTHNYELRYWLAAGGLHPAIMRLKKGTIVVRLMRMFY
ncbi:ABC transporter substrate-binding protein [Photobacterium sanguinicancri]|uniref:ABC transporter substrate-binding protein n=1 Tax=Photobacterium sanguinicancri TaxID=875932 RepID=UPI003B969C93